MAELSPLRCGKITGSRIGKILGLSPYGSRESVLRDMVRQANGLPEDFAGNALTAWGTEHEPDAILSYERLYGVLVLGMQDFITHPTVPYLGVSPDGLVGDDGAVECKCPPEWSHYTDIADKPGYEAQCRLLLECSGRAWCDFVVWRQRGVAVSRVWHDPAWFERVAPILADFHTEYLAALADPGYVAEACAPLRSERTDPAWLAAAGAWLEADADVRAAEDRRALARAELIALAGGAAKSSGGGVNVTRYSKQGAVDYKRAAEEHLSDMDFAPYRREETTAHRVGAAR